MRINKAAIVFEVKYEAGDIIIFKTPDGYAIACQIDDPSGKVWVDGDQEYRSLGEAVSAVADILKLNVSTDFYE